MRVRRANEDDIGQLLPMFHDMGFVDAEAGLRERFPAFCRSSWHHVLVAESEGQLLGYAELQDYGPHLRSGNDHRTVKLNDLYTRPEARRQGVARALLQASLDWVATQPVRYVFWYANPGEARAAYEAMGYRPEESGQ